MCLRCCSHAAAAAILADAPALTPQVPGGRNVLVTVGVVEVIAMSDNMAAQLNTLCPCNGTWDALVMRRLTVCSVDTCPDRSWLPNGEGALGEPGFGIIRLMDEVSSGMYCMHGLLIAQPSITALALFALCATKTLCVTRSLAVLIQSCTLSPPPPLHRHTLQIAPSLAHCTLRPFPHTDDAHPGCAQSRLTFDAHWIGDAYDIIEAVGAGRILAVHGH